jgi:hypothetical protein
MGGDILDGRFSHGWYTFKVSKTAVVIQKAEEVCPPLLARHFGVRQPRPNHRVPLPEGIAVFPFKTAIGAAGLAE